MLKIAYLVSLTAVLLFGSIFMTRRQRCTGSEAYTLSRGFPYLLYWLKRSNSRRDIVGVSGEGWPFNGIDEGIHYDRLFKTLTFHQNGKTQWTEYFVEESELYAAARRKIWPQEFPKFRNPQARREGWGKCLITLLLTFGITLIFFGYWKEKRKQQIRTGYHD
jgi:hypothetical protein